MEFKEKAKIRVEHWLEHNEKHYDEYINFAKELEKNGMIEEKKIMEKVAELTKEISSLFKKLI